MLEENIITFRKKLSLDQIKLRNVIINRFKDWHESFVNRICLPKTATGDVQFLNSESIKIEEELRRSIKNSSVIMDGQLLNFHRETEMSLLLNYLTLYSYGAKLAIEYFVYSTQEIPITYLNEVTAS